VRRRLFVTLAALGLLVGLPGGALAAGSGSQVSASAAPTAIPRAYASLERVTEADELGFARPGGLAWDRQLGRLRVFDVARAGRGVAMTTAGALKGQISGNGTAGNLQALAGVRLDRNVLGATLRGMAVNPANGHRFVFAPATGTLSHRPPIRPTRQAVSPSTSPTPAGW
jgi:hypothetical protein